MSRKRIFASQGFSKMQKRDIVWPDMLTNKLHVYVHVKSFWAISMPLIIYQYACVFTQYLLTQKGIKVEIMIECDCCHRSMNTQIINGFFFFFTTAPFYGMSIVAIFYIIYLCIILHLYTIINYFMIFYLYCIKLNWVCIIFLFILYTFNYHLYYCGSFEHSCIKTQCHKVLVNALFIVCILLFEMIGNII